jgi:hypothetical protein
MRCHKCGKKATKKDTDPYIDELFPENENPELWWCDECYQEQLWEI